MTHGRPDGRKQLCTCKVSPSRRTDNKAIDGVSDQLQRAPHQYRASDSLKELRRDGESREWRTRHIQSLPSTSDAVGAGTLSSRRQEVPAPRLSEALATIEAEQELCTCTVFDYPRCEITEICVQIRLLLLSACRDRISISAPGGPYPGS